MTPAAQFKCTPVPESAGSHQRRRNQRQLYPPPQPVLPKNGWNNLYYYMRWYFYDLVSLIIILWGIILPIWKIRSVATGCAEWSTSAAAELDSGSDDTDEAEEGRGRYLPVLCPPPRKHTKKEGAANWGPVKGAADWGPNQGPTKGPPTETPKEARIGGRKKERFLFSTHDLY